MSSIQKYAVQQDIADDFDPSMLVEPEFGKPRSVTPVTHLPKPINGANSLFPTQTSMGSALQSTFPNLNTINITDGSTVNPRKRSASIAFSPDHTTRKTRRPKPASTRQNRPNGSHRAQLVDGQA